MRRAVLWVTWGIAGLAAPVLAQADDDLAVVKKAVATTRAAASVPPAEAPEGTGAPARKGSKPEPQWLRVRVFEKDGRGETRKRVSVNLPLSLVRVVDDFPIDLCRHHRPKDESPQDVSRCDLKIADVLSALEAGQELVEVEGEDATVKVWVE